MRWTSPAALALIGLFAMGSTPAHATEGIEWQWDDAERTYYIQGQLRLPQFVWFRALNNSEVRVFEARVEMVTTCVPDTALGKKAWELSCTVDDISLQGVPLPADAGRLTPIVEEWDERLTGNQVEVQFSKDGRVRNVGFANLDRRNRRDGENIEVMRQLMARMLSPLDMRLPKKGDDKGLNAWSGKSPLVLAFMSNAGSIGGVDVDHQITAQKDGKLKISSEGNGTSANAGATQQVAGQEQITDFYKMEMVSEAMFDIQSGQLIKRQVAASGVPTASSQMADGTEGLPYIQAYNLVLVPKGDPRPTLPPSKEIQAAFPKG